MRRFVIGKCGHNGVTFGYTVHHQNGSWRRARRASRTGLTGRTRPSPPTDGWMWETFAFSSVNGNDPQLYSLDIALANTTSPGGASISLQSGWPRGDYGHEWRNWRPVLFRSPSPAIMKTLWWRRRQGNRHSKRSHDRTMVRRHESGLQCMSRVICGGAQAPDARQRDRRSQI